MDYESLANTDADTLHSCSTWHAPRRHVWPIHRQPVLPDPPTAPNSTGSESVYQ